MNIEENTMLPKNKDDNDLLTSAYRARNGGYWKVHWKYEGFLYLIGADGTEDDLKDPDGPCWFVWYLEYEGVRLRVRGNPWGTPPLYLGLSGPVLIAKSTWDEKPLFQTASDGEPDMQFQAINGESKGAWLSWVNQDILGDVIGYKDKEDDYCHFTTVDFTSMHPS